MIEIVVKIKSKKNSLTFYVTVEGKEATELEVDCSKKIEFVIKKNLEEFASQSNFNKSFTAEDESADFFGKLRFDEND